MLRGEGLGILETKQKDAEGSKDATPDQGKHQDEGEQMKNSKAEKKTRDM
jgi:hypothetical protein